jgi:hypothetical protein
MHRFFLSVLLVLCFAASATGLDDGDVIDQVFINPSNGKPALALSVDKPVNSSEIEKQLDYKLGTYIGFVRSGELYKRHPKVDQAQRVLIVFVFEYPPSPQVKAMLFRMRDRLIEMGFDVWLRVYDEELKRNVDIEP